MAERALLTKGHGSLCGSPECHRDVSADICEVLNIILFLPLRRLNDNDISVLEAVGLFKKLPNLRKM